MAKMASDHRETDSTPMVVGCAHSWASDERPPCIAQVCMEVITSWTAAEACALQKALRMSNQVFAEHLGIAVRTVAYWRKRPEIVPKLALQEILDRAIECAPERAKAQFTQLAGQPGHRQGRNMEPPRSLTERGMSVIGMSPAHHAVEMGDLKALRDLLDRGVGIEEEYCGLTLLQHAVDAEIDGHALSGEQPHVDTTAYLLARGADPKRRSGGGTGVSAEQMAFTGGHWLASALFESWSRTHPDAHHAT
jgi:DNA-binding transcriptional regulator YiaG